MERYRLCFARTGFYADQASIVPLAQALGTAIVIWTHGASGASAAVYPNDLATCSSLRYGQKALAAGAAAHC